MSERQRIDDTLAWLDDLEERLRIVEHELAEHKRDHDRDDPLFVDDLK